MIGMIQILTYLLCVYLVFKGVEIFQIAFMSPKEKNVEGVTLGVLMIAIAVVVAAVFAYWTTEQASEVQKNLDNIQKSVPRFP